MNIKIENFQFDEIRQFLIMNSFSKKLFVYLLLHHHHFLSVQEGTQISGCWTKAAGNRHYNGLQ